jgi:hypothetical protein
VAFLHLALHGALEPTRHTDILHQCPVTEVKRTERRYTRPNTSGLITAVVDPYRQEHFAGSAQGPSPSNDVLNCGCRARGTLCNGAGSSNQSAGLSCCGRSRAAFSSMETARVRHDARRRKRRSSSDMARARPDGLRWLRHGHRNKRAEPGGEGSLLDSVVRVYANIRNLDDRTFTDSARCPSREARSHRESPTQNLNS